ncbi:exonuclease domain-containing protein [Streptomyces sp. NPDC088252]|uniref:exonuclease domain-containing protein n=1 Tax=Streptomyces sp. NPDC088252 TaxID=3365845 RepID=UPI0038217A1C
MNWWESEFAAFDLETTGTDLEEARIVTSCVAWIRGDGTVRDAWSALVNPGIEIPTSASDVHGFTTELAEAGLDPQDALPGIVNALSDALGMGIPVVAFNARYDFTILDRDCRRNDVQTLSSRTANVVRPILDPFVLDKAVDKYRKGRRTLSTMSELYGVELTNAHDATADAIAAAQVARVIIRQYKGLQMPAEQLHKAQEVWARQQAVSLERYFREKDGNPDIVLDKAWPIVPTEEALTDPEVPA